jgi:hypothetical protein
VSETWVTRFLQRTVEAYLTLSRLYIMSALTRSDMYACIA